jgi:hypothetical protein
LAKRSGDYRGKSIAGLSNVEIATLIVRDKYAEFRPTLERLFNKIVKSTVIHLRLGDVVAGNEWHEREKRPLAVESLKSALENNPDLRYVIGQCFFAQPSSTNYEECEQKSREYLQKVLDELGAVHLDVGCADADLLCAVAAKTFVQGRGYFSRLIVEIRRQFDRPCIETAITG